MNSWFVTNRLLVSRMCPIKKAMSGFFCRSITPVSTRERGKLCSYITTWRVYGIWVYELGCPLLLIDFFMFMLSQIEKSSESGSFVLIWINFGLLNRITILCMTILKLLISFLGGLWMQSYQTSIYLIRACILAAQ